jgi:hypothetical protein
MTEICISNKKSFNSANEAYEHRDFLMQRHGLARQAVYKCSDCSAFHLTTHPQVHQQVKFTLGERIKIRFESRR